MTASEDPYRLSRCGAHYRRQADECGRLLEAMDPRVAASEQGQVLAEELRRHRDLWTQLADEIVTYLAELDEGPGLF